jgi:glycosyltransferase involved in cell wall biosynthesis
MSRIALMTPCLATGDAVSNDVLGMQHALTERGHDVRIFAESSTAPGVEVHTVDKLSRFSSGAQDVLVYHFSVGWAAGQNVIEAFRGKRVVKYHNITPPEFFDRISPEYAAPCRAGREQIERVAKSKCDLFLSDSNYNMQELIAHGADGTRSFVVPPFHHIDRLRYLDADLDVLNRYRDGVENIIMVGRLAPNKGHGMLIDAFASYHRLYNKKSRLIIIGNHDERLSIYVDFLRHKVRSYKLDQAIHFTGAVSLAALKSFYLTAHFFAIASDHEGFCVPVVEAMSMKIPIVAYATVAVAETVGNCGIVWDNPDPLLLALSLDHLNKEPHVRDVLADAGYRRYVGHFSNEVITGIFLKTVSCVL